MPHPGFVRSDLCLIRAAAEQAEFADAARRLLSADGHLLAYHGICDLTNAAIGDVLHTCGYPVWQPGTGRARLVADHRSQGTEAGR